MTTKIRPSTLENTAVSAGTYGGQGSSAAIIPVVTVDSQGRLTYAANTTLPSLLTSTSVGGAASVSRFTVAANGMITSANSIAISIDGSAISSGTVAAARMPFTMNQNVGTTNSPTFSGLTLTSLSTGTISASGAVGTGALTVTGTMSASGATSTGALTVTGAITATGDITAFFTSDARLKDNLQPITDALSKVKTLDGVTFNWNNLAEDKDLDVREAGVIAQQVQNILPEVVTQRDNGYLAVRYEKLVPLLIEAIKELNAKVEQLEKNK
jgi:hypothetical protein